MYKCVLRDYIASPFDQNHRDSERQFKNNGKHGTLNTQTAHMQLMSPEREKTHASAGKVLIWFQMRAIHNAASVPLRRDWTAQM